LHFIACSFAALHRGDFFNESCNARDSHAPTLISVRHIAMRAA
jgi:hypothetical protein